MCMWGILLRLQNLVDNLSLGLTNAVYQLKIFPLAVHTVARTLAAAQTLAEDTSAGGTIEQTAARTMVVQAA